MLQELFGAIEKQMKAKLDEIRAAFSNPGNKGGSAEGILRQFLREYLPRRLDVGHGEVIDSFGGRSKQTDVVIVNEDHPFISTPSEPSVFFVEGVSAVGEVKLQLTSEELDRTIGSARKLKTLKSRDPAGVMRCSNASDFARFYSAPPYFLFAFESSLTLDSVLEKLRAAGTCADGVPGAGIDAAFLLERGVAIDFGDGKGGMTWKTPEQESVPGWNASTTPHVLFDMLGWLCSCLPRRLRMDPILLHYLFEKD